MNTLNITDLRVKIRGGKTPCTQCDERIATDVHHKNGHHHDHTPENLEPICKLCHDEIHGISDQLNDLALVVRQFYAVQDMRKAMSNRIQAYHRLGYYAQHAGEVFDKMTELESYIGNVASEMVKNEPIYNAWLKHVKGIGPILSAALISRIGSIERFEFISSLWAYAGLHVVDGKAPKRAKGQKANWDPELKMLAAFKVPSQFVKVPTSFGRKLYDQYKSFYDQVHDGRCPVWSHPDAKVNKAGTKATVNSKGCSRKGHVHNMSTRKVGKIFLACLWMAWRELEGLPITEPYPVKLGHSHIIRPEEWIDGNQLALTESRQT